MRVLVTGSREWTNEQAMRIVLDAFFSEGSELCHGAARGADLLAGVIGHEIGYKVSRYPVERGLDGPWPAAGMNRNRRMFDDFKPDVVLAFPLPQSKGTVGMMAYARSKGCTVKDYGYMA